MVERRYKASRDLGYLHIEGNGGCPARHMRDLLAALEESYQAAARVELAAERLFAGVEWLTHHGPGPRYWLLGSVLVPGPRELLGEPADRLIVTRVVLESPGFGSFSGPLTRLRFCVVI
jgi:hypothetical protein